MAKPIPVFAFVFAAFASTSIKAQAARQLEKPLEPHSPSGEASAALLDTWRLLWRRRLGVTALVGVAREDPAETLWLAEVRESGDGMIGVLTDGPCAPRRAGERIRFGLDDVIDWRIVAPKAAGGKPSHGIGPNARPDVLASREEFARTQDHDAEGL